MTTHPLNCCKAFERAKLADIIGLSLQAPSSLPFVIAGAFGQTLCYTSLGKPLYYPSAIVYRLAGNNYRRIAWLSPALGMSLLTLTGRAAFEFMPNPLLKGLIYGAHSCAMGILTNLHNGNSARIITLRQVLSTYIGLHSALLRLSAKDQPITHQRSEILASVALIAVSLGLSFFGGFHVITANAIGHAAAAATKVVSHRIFAIIAKNSTVYTETT